MREKEGLVQTFITDALREGGVDPETEVQWVYDPVFGYRNNPNHMVRTQGEITFAGTRIDGRVTESIVRLGVAHVPDGRGTFVNLSVEENLRLGAHTRRDKNEVAADFERMQPFGWPVVPEV